MSDTKYGHLLSPKTKLQHTEPWPTMEWTGATDLKTDVTFMVTRVAAPCTMEEFPHSHDFDMYLTFYNYDPDDPLTLPAEIEIGLGPEPEMHVINAPTTVYTSIAGSYVAKKE